MNPNIANAPTPRPMQTSNMTTSNFLTPLLIEFNDRINAAVANAQANILAEFAGFAQAAVSDQPRGFEAASTGKRSPAEIARQAELVFNVIKANPGSRIEHLSERCGMTTKDMSLPIKKLRAEKRIAVRGQKRSTTYTAK